MKKGKVSHKIEKSANGFFVMRTITQDATIADLMNLKNNVETEINMLYFQRQDIDEREVELKEQLAQINAAILEGNTNGSKPN